MNRGRGVMLKGKQSKKLIFDPTRKPSLSLENRRRYIVRRRHLAHAINEINNKYQPRISASATLANT